jgi:hypothetical protein
MLSIVKITYSSLQALLVTFLARDVSWSISIEITSKNNQIVNSTFGCLLFNILAR